MLQKYAVELAGLQGAGKTHTALSFPFPALLDTELKAITPLDHGVGNPDRVAIAHSWDDVVNFLSFAIGDDGVQTLIFDSSRDIYEMATAATLIELKKKSLYIPGEGAILYAHVHRKMNSLVEACRQAKKYCVFTARVKDEYVGGNTTGRMVRDGWNKTPYKVDIMLQAVSATKGIPERMIPPEYQLWRVVKNSQVRKGQTKPFLVNPLFEDIETLAEPCLDREAYTQEWITKFEESKEPKETGEK